MKDFFFLPSRKKMLLKNNRFLSNEYGIAGENPFIILLFAFEVKQLPSKHFFRKNEPICKMSNPNNF